MISKLRALDLNLLPVFDTLMQQKNLSRAATQLAMSQSAVSHALKRLRHSFDDELFVRTARGLKPTQRAYELHDSIQAGLQIIEHACAAPEFDPAQSEVDFSFSMNSATEYLMAAQLLSMFRRKAPKVRVQLHSDYMEDVQVKLKDGALDYAIDYMPPLSDDFHQRLLVSDHLCVISAQNHPAIKKQISLKQFETLPQVSLLPRVRGFNREGRPVSTPIKELMGDRLPERNIAMHVSNYASMPDIVAACDLIAVVPKRLAQQEKYQAKINTMALPFDCPAVDVRLIWHKSRDQNPAHRWLLENLEAFV